VNNGTQDLSGGSRKRDVHASRVVEFFDNTYLWLRESATISIRRAVAGALVRQLAGSGSCHRILDVGCGDGSVSIQFAGEAQRLTLVDLSDKMLAMARDRTPPTLMNRVEYIQGDISDVALAGTYDVILCFGVLAHVASVEQTMELLAALLNPSGLLLLQITDAGHGFVLLYNFVNGLWNKLSTKMSQGYEINHTRFHDILALAEKLGLRLEFRRKYIDNFFLIHKLSPLILRRLCEFSYNSTSWQIIGSENILALRKQ
jgi:ubiquinone/menaquinone biosynthesis C-methylase UbiE